MVAGRPDRAAGPERRENPMTAMMSAPAPLPTTGDRQVAERTAVLHCIACDTTVHVDRGEPIPTCATGHIQ